MKTNQTLMLFVIVCILYTLQSYGQSSVGVAINTDGTPAHPSAMLDVQAISKGFLAPRMTQTQRIAIQDAAEGLLIYQTDAEKGFYFYDAATQVWVPIGGNPSPWIISGNEIYYTDGNVGIGTVTPVATLDVDGSFIFTGGCGDVNGNGYVDNVDILLVQDYISGGSAGNLTREQRAKADVNGDGIINMTDVMIMMMEFLDYPSEKVRKNARNNIGIYDFGDLDVVGDETFQLRGLLQLIQQTSPVLSSADRLYNIGGKLHFNGEMISSPWSLNGNANTNPTVNFLGTIDEKALALRTNNVERMRVTSNGLVGIGTASPTVQLDVSGKARFTGSRANVQIITTGFEGVDNNAVFASNSSYHGHLGYWEDMGDLGAGVMGRYNNVYGHLGFSGTTSGGHASVAVYGKTTNPDNFSGFFEGGNVFIEERLGLGIETPAEKLDVSGNIKVSGSIAAGNAEVIEMIGLNSIGVEGVRGVGSDWGVIGYDIGANLIGGIGAGIANAAVYGSASAPTSYSGYFSSGRFYVEGMVGLGVLNPTNRLHISGANPLRMPDLLTSSDTDFLVVDATGVVTKRNIGSGINWSVVGNTGTNPSTNFIGTSDNQALAFRSNNTEHIRLMPDGKVGIGTYAPTVLLDVNGQVKSQHDFYDATAELIVTEGWEATVNYAVRGTTNGVFGALGHNEDGLTLGAGVVGKAGTTTGHLAYFDEDINAAVFGKVGNASNFSGYFEGGPLFIEKNLGVGISEPIAKLHVESFQQENTVAIKSFIITATEARGIESTAVIESAGGDAYAGYFHGINAGDETTSAYGIYGKASGVTGLQNYGVYGTATGSVTKNWAGYFNDGDVYIKNKLGLGTEEPSQQLELTGSIELPNTNNSSTGIIFKDGERFLHNYGGDVAGSFLNTFLGRNSGNFSIGGGGSGEGVENTGIGALALNSLQWGGSNTAVGVSALQNTVGGSDNTALGVAAGRSVSNGTGNTLIGHYAGSNITTGSNNIVIGKSAAVPSATGNHQVVIGTAGMFYGDIELERIGLGTTNPSEKLHVNGNIKTNKIILAHGSDPINIGPDNSWPYSSFTLFVFGHDQGIEYDETPAGLFWTSNMMGSGKFEFRTQGNIMLPVAASEFFGTWAGNAISAGKGGTGQTTLTSGKVLVGNGTAGVLSPTNLHWDNTNSRLGIGVTSPSNRLHVNGTNPLRLEGLQTSTENEVLVVNANGVVSKRNIGSGAFWSSLGNSGTNANTNFIGTIDNQPLAIRSNNTEVMRITPQKNVGIGTATPGTNNALHVYRGLQYPLPNDVCGIYVNTFHWDMGGANTGIKSEAITEHAQLIGTQTTYGIFGRAEHIQYDNETWGLAYGLYASAQGASTNWAGYFDDGNVHIKNNLGIGTLAPTQKLDVNGSIKASGNLIFAGNLNGGNHFEWNSSTATLQLGYYLEQEPEAKIRLAGTGGTYVQFENKYASAVISSSANQVGINNAPRSNAELDVHGTGAIIVPVGTTAQRPSTAVQGMIRFNTSTGEFEGYNGTSWVILSYYGR